MRRTASCGRFLCWKRAACSCGVPDWWNARQPARPQVQVKIGQQPGGGLLGVQSLMDFSVEVALEGATISKAEWKQLMAAKAGLVLLRGKWVEIDKDRLQQVLAHWRKVAGNSADGVSFLEGMRLLAGIGRAGAAEEPVGEAQAREWSQVVPGEWLAATLAAMRDPSGNSTFDPEHDLRARLRPYQRDGVRWLHFLTRLGLGACLADDMGLGKTIQTIALLLQLKRESASSPDRKKTPPSLLVAPASLLANWKNEIGRFALGTDRVLRSSVGNPGGAAQGPCRGPRLHPGKGLGGHHLRAVDPAAMVARLRVAVGGSRRGAGHQESGGPPDTRGVKELRAQGRIVLTGTPVENRLGDLWSLFDFINPGLLGRSAGVLAALSKS